MKTTLILNDTIVRKAKARAALQGVSLSRYMEKSLEDSLKAREPGCVGDWIHSLPETPRGATKEISARIKEGAFDQIDPEMWQ